MPILRTVEEAPSKVQHKLPRVIPEAARKEKMAEKEAKEARLEKVARTHLVEAKAAARRVSMVVKAVEKERQTTNSKAPTSHRLHVKVMH